MRTLFLEHEEDGPAALVEAHTRRLGHTISKVLVGRDPYPPLAEVDFLVVMGSVKSVTHDRDPETRVELSLIEKALETGVPVLGICFGSQALARVLGGQVARSPHPEIGWFRIESDDPRIPEGPWFQWHYDRFTVPPGATEIARNEAAPQAYRYGSSLGVQFHPEVTPPIIDLWLRAGPEVTEHGFDPDQIREDTERHFPRSQALVGRLIDGFLEPLP